MNKLGIVFFSILIISFFGCAATQTAIEKKDPNVVFVMDRPIFITPSLGNKVFLQMRNLSSLHVSSEELQMNVEQKLTQRGFVIVPDPKDADYMIQAQLISAEAEIIPARERGDSAGGGVGAVAGALLGAIGSSWESVGIGAGSGAIAGGTAEAISGSAVKDVKYIWEIALRVSDRTGQEGQSIMTISVEKVNLTPEVALPILVDRGCEAIANVL